MEKTDRIRSYFCQLVLNVPKQEFLGNTIIIAKVMEILVKAIGMQCVDDNGPRIDILDSPIPGMPSVSANQPLKTSIASGDTWPEYRRIILFIHSCQDFLELCPEAIRQIEQFLNATLIQAVYADLCEQETTFDLEATKHWSLNLTKRTWTQYRCVPAAPGEL